MLSRAGGSGLPQPVHRPGARKPRAGKQFRRRAGTARGVDRRLHHLSARPTTIRPSRRCPRRSRNGSSTSRPSLRRRCSSTRPATPGTTAATSPASNGCTWATRREFRSIADGATRSPTPATQASSSRDEDIGTRLSHRPGFRRCAAACARRVEKLRRLEAAVADRRSPARRGDARRTGAVRYDVDGAAAQAGAHAGIVRSRCRGALGAGCRACAHRPRNPWR